MKSSEPKTASKNTVRPFHRTSPPMPMKSLPLGSTQCRTNRHWIAHGNTVPSFQPYVRPTFTLTTLGQTPRPHSQTRRARYSSTAAVLVHPCRTAGASSVARNQNHGLRPPASKASNVSTIKLLHAAEAISAKFMFRCTKSLLKLPAIDSNKPERRSSN